MKIFINCKSKLTQVALEFYLKGFLSSKEDCDFIVSDMSLEADLCDLRLTGSKLVCKVLPFSQRAHSDILRPFHEFSLFENINNFYRKNVATTAKSTDEAPLANQALPKQNGILQHDFMEGLVSESTLKVIKNKDLRDRVLKLMKDINHLEL